MENIDKFDKLHEILKQEYKPRYIVRIKDIATVKKSADNKPLKQYDEMLFYEVGPLHLDNKGYIIEENAPIKKKNINIKAKNRDILIKGDLFFSHRSKIGRVGIMDRELKYPVIPNRGTLSLRLNKPDMNVSKYIANYLATPLISSFLYEMRNADSVVKSISPRIVEDLYIPYDKKFIDSVGFQASAERIEEVKQVFKDLEKISNDALTTSGNLLDTQIHIQALQPQNWQPLFADDEVLDRIKSLKDQIEALSNQFKQVKTILSEPFQVFDSIS